MNLVFFGDGAWGQQCLNRLVQEGHTILAVVVRSNPSNNDLEDLANELNLTIKAPKRVNDIGFVDWITSLSPDLNISMSYDQIFRKPILESAHLGFINAHAGKLPHYRGRSVINWAIINDEKGIGLTVHFIDEGIDTGDIILQETIPVDWLDTFATILEKVYARFPPLLSQAVALIAQNAAPRIPQDPMEGSYFSSRTNGDEWIDWKDSSLNIYNKIRAISRPGPGARTVFIDQTLILWQAYFDPAWTKYIGIPGQVVGLMPDKGVIIKTGDSTIVVSSVQFDEEGDSEMTPSFPIGTRLGINPSQAVTELQLLRKQIMNNRRS